MRMGRREKGDVVSEKGGMERKRDHLWWEALASTEEPNCYKALLGETFKETWFT